MKISSSFPPAELSKASMAWLVFGLIRSLLAPLLLLVAVASVHFLSACGVIPSTVVLSSFVERLFVQYGLPLVGVCSFIENIAGINVYFPGSVAILTGMALTSGNPARALATYLAIVFPAALANQLNYLAGRFVGKIPKVPRDSKALRLWYIATYWHPHLAATTAFASGAQGVPYQQYCKYLVIASLFWSSFWALLIYYFGAFVGVGENLLPFSYGYIILWLGWEIWKLRRGFRSSQHSDR